MIIDQVRFDHANGDVLQIGDGNDIEVSSKDLYASSYKDTTYQTGSDGRRIPVSQYFDEHKFTLTFKVRRVDETGATFRRIIGFFEQPGLYTAALHTVYGLPAFRFSVTSVDPEPWSTADGDLVDVTCVSEYGAFLKEEATSYPFQGTNGGWTIPTNTQKFTLGNVINQSYVDVTNTSINPIGWRLTLRFPDMDPEATWSIEATFPDGSTSGMGGVSQPQAGSTLRIETVPAFSVTMDGKTDITSLDYSQSQLFTLPSGTTRVTVTASGSSEAIFETIVLKNVIAEAA
jgi:hypothetical protein